MFFMDEKFTLTRRSSSLVKKKASITSLEVTPEPSTQANDPAHKNGYSGPHLTKSPSVTEQIVILFFEAAMGHVVQDWDTVETIIAPVTLSPSELSAARLKTESEVSVKVKKGKKTAASGKTKKSGKASNPSLMSAFLLEEVATHAVYWQKPDERAIILFKNGNRYEGSVSSKCMHGEGRFQWTNGTVYMGSFYLNEMKGRGKIEWPNGSWYEGEFVGNARHGRGLLVEPGEYFYYQGDWHRAAKHGKGIIHYGLTNYYDGDWDKNTRHGFGERQYNKLSGYLGEWKHNLRHGNGKMIWPNKDFYNGEWQRGVMFGRGSYVWDAHLTEPLVKIPLNTYEGEWEYGMRHGHGIIELGYANGAVYKGELVHNKKHGRGCIITGYGNVYKDRRLFDNDNVLCIIAGEEIKTIKIDKSILELDRHVDKAVDMLNTDKKNKMSPVQSYSKPASTTTGIEDEGFKVEEEKRNLALAIQNHQKELTEVYNHYARIGNQTDVIFDQYLIRLHLWQIFNDCELSYRGYTIIHLDNLLSREKNLLMSTNHNPFERIFFWQFVHIMVIIALEMSDLCVRRDLSSGRVLSRIFRSFVNEILVPSVGRFRDISKRLNCEPSAVLSAYSFYKRIGKPSTIREFLQTVRYPYTVRKSAHPKLVENDVQGFKENINLVALGKDVYLDLPKSIYAEDLSTLFLDVPQTDLPLFNISNLTTKAILQLFQKIYPKVIQKDRVINVDIEITFYAFFEVLVMASEISWNLREEEILWRKKYPTSTDTVDTS